MAVEITSVLSKDTKQAYAEAWAASVVLHDAHCAAENKAFMALMAQIGVSIGDKVTIRRGRYDGPVEDQAILIGPKKFAQIKKDGTASQREYHTYAPYTVEKFTQP